MIVIHILNHEILYKFSFMNSGYYKYSNGVQWDSVPLYANFHVPLYPKRHFDTFESVTTQPHNIVQKPVKVGINNGIGTL